MKRRLELDHPQISWPAASTMGELLAHTGLSKRRQRRRHVPPCTAPLAHCRRPNDTWSADFKGWFRTGDGSRCDALTMQDQASRYVIRVVAVAGMDGAHVWAVFDAAFREYGLPATIRSDNGPPFASTGAGGLSALAVRLVKAGVVPERIAPASPQQNGYIERFNGTMEREVAAPSCSTSVLEAEVVVEYHRPEQ